MPARNINLTEHFDLFVEAGVASGKFTSASEMMREGLRLLEQRDEEDRARVEWLRGAVKEGVADVERGRYTVLRSEGELEDFMREARAEASGKRERA